MAAPERDRERMVTFYCFPKEHWSHLRTTNIMEITVCGRTAAHGRKQTLQASGERDCTDLEVLLVADRRFRRLRSPPLLSAVAVGRKYVDGIEVRENQERNAA